MSAPHSYSGMRLHLKPLSEISVLAIVDNELDPISPAPGSVNVTGRLGDLAGRVGRDVSGEFGRGGGGGGRDGEDERKVVQIGMEQICCAAHGLSLLVTATPSDSSRPNTLLFDTGPTESIFRANTARLSPALEPVDCIHLSHWHRDHSGGMLAAIKLINEAKEKAHSHSSPTPHPSTFNQTDKQLIVDVHPSRPLRRGVKPSSSDTIICLEPDPSFEEMEKAGARVEKNSQTHVTPDGCFLISGEIPRVTEWEKGIRGGVRWEGEVKGWVEDQEIGDERFVVGWLEAKGLVLFTGCSHAGLINICKHALTLTQHLQTPPIPLYAVVGGFHLADADPAHITATVQELKKMDVRVLMAGHCTGWRAKFEIERAFEGEGRLVPSFVGIRTVLQGGGGEQRGREWEMGLDGGRICRGGM